MKMKTKEQYIQLLSDFHKNRGFVYGIGKRLSVEGLEKGYGSSVVKQLANDLQQEFPGTTGFSAPNLWDMKKFFEFYKDTDKKLQQLVALLPWKHNLLIMSKTTSINEAKYYAEQCYENNWSRNVLLNFIRFNPGETGGRRHR
jgi:predicted nuclease of restriction endonuclease-like (RecB) superfamily